MSKISDFASNSIMGVVRKIVNHIVDNVDPQISDVTDHLPARFSGTFNDSTRNLTMTIESQGASAENLVATVNIPAGGGGSGGPTYSAGNGITITPENAIEIDTNITATKASVTALQNEVGDAFSQVAIGADGKSLDFTALDGQVNNIEIPSSGVSNEWVELDLNNLPSDFKVGDSVKILLYYISFAQTCNGWTSAITKTGDNETIKTLILPLEITFYDNGSRPYSFYKFIGTSLIQESYITISYNQLNSNTLFSEFCVYYNGNSNISSGNTVTRTTLNNFVYKIYRKTST